MNRHEPAVATRAAAFQRIVDYYQRRYELLRCRDGFPYRLTARGAWATSDPQALYHFFSRLGLEECELLVDLGSGDGIVTCIAALFTRAVGIEIDRQLVWAAKRAVEQLGLDKRVRLICGDYTRLILGKADCLYIYPDKPVTGLQQRAPGWKGRLLVYGPHFPVEGWETVAELSRGRERMTVYRPR